MGGNQFARAQHGGQLEFERQPRLAIPRQVVAVEAVPENPDFVLGQDPLALMLLRQLRKVEAGSTGFRNVVPTSLSRPSVQAVTARLMCLALLTEGTPNLPSRMSFDNSAMCWRVTSRGSMWPSFGLTKRRRWLATFFQLSIWGRISPSCLRTSVFIQSMRSSIIFATVMPCLAFCTLRWCSCSTSAAGSMAFAA